MFDSELRSLIFQVITSWQVIVVTIVILLYFALINFVIKSRRHRVPSPPKAGKKAKEAVQEEQVDDSELGLEE